MADLQFKDLPAGSGAGLIAASAVDIPCDVTTGITTHAKRVTPNMIFEKALQSLQPAGSFAALTTTGDVSAGGDVLASGDGNFGGTLTALGNFAINSTKFTVAASSGNTAIAGTLGVASNFAVATSKFTVAASTGNTAVAGTFAATGNLAVNTDKFTVAASSGNTVVAGTFAVAGDVAVATNKFTINASSGNTAIAGTLGVTGNFAVATNKFTVDASNGNTAVYGALSIRSGACAISTDGSISTIGTIQSTSDDPSSFNGSLAVLQSLTVSEDGTFTGRVIAQNVEIAHGILSFGSPEIDFAGDGFETISLSGDVTFTTANLSAGRSKTLRIRCDGSTRNFTFPGDWKFIGAAAPSSIAAGKDAILTLTAFGTTDDTVIAAYAVEP